MTKEQLLEKANRNYYKGVHAVSVVSGNIFKSEGKFTIDGLDVGCYAPDEKLFWICVNGQWAEIISKPEQTETTGYSEVKEYHEPVEIEKEPLYLELLEQLEAKDKELQEAREIIKRMHNDAEGLKDSIAHYRKLYFDLKDTK